jgi:hypothetical protein
VSGRQLGRFAIAPAEYELVQLSGPFGAGNVNVVHLVIVNCGGSRRIGQSTHSPFAGRG